jgi:hypothetical protein
MADAQKKDILADWWVKWREADFTWEGLARDTKDKRLQGWVVADGLLREAENGRIYGQPILETPAPVKGRPANLQDYWRADPAPGPNIGRLRSDAEMGEELVHAEGQPTYHRAHLPLEYPDGAPTGKEGWADDALDAIVHPRLLVASETAWQGEWLERKIVGPDRDAQLQGGSWLKAAAHPAGAGHPLSLRHNLALIFRYCSFRA